VAYTLINNPYIQRYTASNISLLAQENELKDNKVFLLEHTIQDVEADMKEMQLKKKVESLENSEIDIGTELTEDNAYEMNEIIANGTTGKKSDFSTLSFPKVTS